MRIAVNALFLRPGRVGGTEVALRGMLDGLSRLGETDRIRVYVARDEEGGIGFPSGVQVVGCPCGTRPRARRIAWEQLVLPAWIARDGADVIWNAGFTAPLASSAPQVTSIFDLQHLEHPENFRPAHRLAWRVLVDGALARSRRIVVPSEASRLALTSLRPRDAAKARVVPLAAEDALRDGVAAGADDERRLVAMGVRSDFLLCPGTTHPHKGHATLLRALAMLGAGGGAVPPLVVTGVSGFAHYEVLGECRRLGLGESVRMLGWVSRADLVALYRRARMVVIPTRFEGFGLPLLEAMAAGAAVVASDLPVLREIGGDGVCWVAAGDEAGWAARIAALLDDATKREELVDRARARSAPFTWERSARMLRGALDEATTSASIDVEERREV